MKLGLALSGGGVKGAAHIGVIKALEENGILISAIGGSSIGSIVATLYAMGYTTEEMLKLFTYFSKNLLKADPKYFVSNMRVSKSILGYGFLSGDSIEGAMKECASLKQISSICDIKIPLAIPTVDVIDCKKYVFTNRKIEKEEYVPMIKKEDGEYVSVLKKTEDVKYITDAKIEKAVRASCSYPGLFAPCLYENHKFVDGGVLDNVPAAEVKKLGVDKVLSIKFPPNMGEDPKHLYDIAFKAIDILFNEIDCKAIQDSDYVLDVDVTSSSLFNVRKINYCYDTGYVTAITKIEEIKKILE